MSETAFKSAHFASNVRHLMDLQQTHDRALASVILSELDPFEADLFASVTPAHGGETEALRRWLFAGTREWGALPETAALRRRDRHRAFKAQLSCNPPQLLLDRVETSPLQAVGLALRSAAACLNPSKEPFVGRLVFGALASSLATLAASIGFAAYSSGTPAGLAVEALFATEKAFFSAWAPHFLLGLPIAAAAVVAFRLKASWARNKGAFAAAKAAGPERDAAVDAEVDSALEAAGFGFFGDRIAKASEALAASALVSDANRQGTRPDLAFLAHLGTRPAESLKPQALIALAERLQIDAAVDAIPAPAPRPSSL